MGRVLHYKIMLKIELGLEENAECQICIRAISAIHAFEDKGGSMTMWRDIAFSL